MRHKSLLALTVLCGLISAAVPVAAHHSFAAQYDRNKPKTLNGSVTKVDWINPHARFFVDVTENGKVTNWEVELGAPAILMRRGWTRNSLQVGTKVTVAGSLAKDGSSMLNASTVTLADGKRVFSAGSSGEEQGVLPPTTTTPAPTPNR
jgi:hypothetical protein